MTKFSAMLIILFFATSANSFSECPSLEGQYYCDGAYTPNLNIREIDKEGVRIYKINGQILRADGIPTTQDIISPTNKPAILSKFAFCENEELISMITYRQKDHVNPYIIVTIKHFLDDFGDVIIDHSVKSELGDIRSVKNCRS